MLLHMIIFIENVLNVKNRIRYDLRIRYTTPFTTVRTKQVSIMIIIISDFRAGNS